ncbi:VOC family protein [Marinicella sp. W31]|uniref:VOC family protein n=1 Tax=Marinicella sp. W31 TaxID=3023713 RepID=UPI0037584A8D
MEKVRAIGGVFFKCKDPEGLATWYKEHLGFDLAAPFCAAFDLHKAPKAGDQTVWGTFKQDTDYFNPSTHGFMINLIVDDVQAMLKQVEKGGGQPVGEPSTDEYGTFGWFIDPEGIKVELWSPPSPENT